jgi:hypothetical protein
MRVEGRRVEYCVGSTEGMQREMDKCGAVIQPLLRISCYLRNQRLGATKDA